MSTVSELKLLINDIIDTNSTNFPDSRKVRLLNKAQDKVVNLIMQKDTLEQWDDPNYTDLAEGYLNIVDGQIDYNVREDENFADLLFISKVFIIQSATDTDYVEVDKQGKAQTYGEGVPSQYRISGSRIIFDTEFNYDKTNGIKLMFGRTPKPITINDTTKKIGIPVTFHHLIALYVSYDYARAKGMANRNDILNEIITEEQRLGFFIRRQDNGTNLVITTEEVNPI